MSTESRRIFLASQSPRRKMLLEAACFDVRVLDQRADERWPVAPPDEAVVAVAQRKLDAAVAPAGEVVLAADTVVILQGDPRGDTVDGGRLLTKPQDADDARAMLQALSGREHRVYSGFCMVKGARRHAQCVMSRVRFRPLTRAEIDRYVATGECFDRAGSYAIQGMGGAFVERVEGSYTNIVGLPLAEVIKAWETLG